MNFTQKRQQSKPSRAAHMSDSGHKTGSKKTQMSHTCNAMIPADV